jgi:hypothetical protein
VTFTGKSKAEVPPSVRAPTEWDRRFAGAAPNKSPYFAFLIHTEHVRNIGSIHVEDVFGLVIENPPWCGCSGLAQRWRYTPAQKNTEAQPLEGQAKHRSHVGRENKLRKQRRKHRRNSLAWLRNLKKA